jgi:hypothetical protein
VIVFGPSITRTRPGGAIDGAPSDKNLRNEAGLL